MRWSFALPIFLFAKDWCQLPFPGSGEELPICAFPEKQADILSIGHVNNVMEEANSLMYGTED